MPVKAILFAVACCQVAGTAAQAVEGRWLPQRNAEQHGTDEGTQRRDHVAGKNRILRPARVASAPG